MARRYAGCGTAQLAADDCRHDHKDLFARLDGRQLIPSAIEPTSRFQDRHRHRFHPKALMGEHNIGGDRMGKRALNVLTAVLIGMPLLASAAPAQWSSGSGGNDHWYSVYCCNSWSGAVTAATTSSFGSLSGYVATVTSAGENAFITNLVLAAGYDQWWLGASDEGNEGVFTWRQGPESGALLSYTNWAPNEPNNYLGNENYLLGAYSAPPGIGSFWNDGPGGAVFAYVVEFSSPIPEPAPAALMVVGLALVGLGGARKLTHGRLCDICPGFTYIRDVGTFLMNGGRNGEEGSGAESAIHGQVQARDGQAGSVDRS